MIRGILFDLDETLADSREPILAWWRGYFQEIGREFPPPEVQHRFYTLPQEAIVRAFGLGAEGDAAYARYLARVGAGDTVSGVRLASGARSVLDWCRERYELALATNRSSQLATLLERLGIASYFRVVVSGETAPHFKPHPWGIHHVLERLGLAPAEMLFVGDSPDDVAFARNGGIRSVAVGTNWKRGPHPPTWALERIGDLPGLLETVT